MDGTARTEDLSAASPTWIDASSGLPDEGDGYPLYIVGLCIDPHNPDDALCAAGTSTGAGIYRMQNWRTSGSTLGSR